MDKQLDILAFGSHPDDVELGCGATIAKQVSMGSKVGIIDLTRGELGTRGSADIRGEEAELAAQILGVEFRYNLGFRDGFFQNDEKHQMELVKIIREYRPRIVLANAVRDRHPDHKKGSDLVSTACFLAGLHKIETGQEAWRPELIYHYIQFEEIEFYRGTSSIKKKSEKKVKRLADFLALNAIVKIEIQGHVNAKGKNTPSNVRLSKKRAKRVLKKLIQNGIDKDRLTAVGLGNSAPVYPKPKHSYEEQANRRVEIMIK